MLRFVLLALSLFSVGAMASQPCEQEIAAVCPSGYIDGCFLRAGRAPLTLFHVCVSKTAKKSPACELEIAAVCDEGERDACAFRPAVSRYHVCVLENAGE